MATWTSFLDTESFIASLQNHVGKNLNFRSFRKATTITVANDSYDFDSFSFLWGSDSDTIISLTGTTTSLRQLGYFDANNVFIDTYVMAVQVYINKRNKKGDRFSRKQTIFEASSINSGSSITPINLPGLRFGKVIATRVRKNDWQILMEKKFGSTPLGKLVWQNLFNVSQKSMKVCAEMSTATIIFQFENELLLRTLKQCKQCGISLVLDLILTYLSYDYFLELFFSAMTGSTSNRRFADQRYRDNRVRLAEVSDVDDCEVSEEDTDFDINSYVRLPPCLCRSTMNVFEEMSIQFDCSTAT